MSISEFGRSGRDHAGDVAVADQHDARAGLAHLGDQLLVAVAVEDAGDQVRHLALLGLGEVAQVLADRARRDRPRRRASRRRRRSCPCRCRARAGSCRVRPARRRRARWGRPWRSAWCLPADRRRCPSAVRRRRPSRRCRASAPRPFRLRRSPRCRRWRPVSKARRIASTAAPSASFFLPRPIQREAASAAASVTRTSSRARLRSVTSPGCGV